MKKQLLRILSALLAVAMLVGSLAGCTSSTTATTKPATTTSAQAATTRTITDMYGTQITVPAVINRVIATGLLMSSIGWFTSLFKEDLPF